MRRMRGMDRQTSNQSGKDEWNERHRQEDRHTDRQTERGTEKGCISHRLLCDCSGFAFGWNVDSVGDRSDGWSRRWNLSSRCSLFTPTQVCNPSKHNNQPLAPPLTSPMPPSLSLPLTPQLKTPLKPPLTPQLTPWLVGTTTATTALVVARFRRWQ